jgi:hypothetical protein
MIKFYTVGALTTKVHAYNSRSWEFIQKFEVVNYLDIFGSKLEIILKSKKIFKVTSVIKSNTLFNKNYLISDYSRFLFTTDKRLEVPYLNISNDLKFLNHFLFKLNINLIVISWYLGIIIIIIKYITNAYLAHKKEIILMDILNTGDIFNNYFINYYTLLVTNNTNNNNNNNNEIFQDLFFNLNNKNSICLININLRYQNPLLLLKFQQLSILNIFKIYYFGFKNFISNFDFNKIKCIYLGNQIKDYYTLLNGKSRHLVIYFKIHEICEKIIILNNNINFNVNNNYNKNFIFYTIFDDLNSKKNLNSFDFVSKKSTWILNNNINQITSTKFNSNFFLTSTLNINFICTLIFPGLETFEYKNFYTSITNKKLYSLNISKIHKFSLSIREVLFCLIKLLFKFLNLNNTSNQNFYLKLLNYLNIFNFTCIILSNTSVYIKFKIFFTLLNTKFINISINILKFFFNIFCIKDIYLFNLNFTNIITYKYLKNFEFFKYSNHNIFLDLNISNVLALVLKNLIFLHKNFIF